MVTSLVLVLFAGVTLGDEVRRSPAGSARSFVVPGASLEGAAATGQLLSHALDVTAGHYVHLAVEPQGVSILATLVDPAGRVIAEDRDRDGGDGPLSLSAIAAQTGVHELKLVVPDKDKRSGRYRLTLDAPHAASEADRLRARAAGAYTEGVRLEAKTTAASWVAAMKPYEEAREISHRLSDARGEALALSGIGSVQFGHGSTPEALATTQAALSLYRIAGDRRGEAATLADLGVFTFYSGDSRGALAYYNRALPIARELGLVRIEGRVLSGIGSAHKNLGDARTALGFFERSLPLRRQAGDLGGESTSLSNLGVAYRMLGDRGRALTAYEAALPLARAADDMGAENGVLQNLGALSLSVGDLERGEEFLASALALSRRMGDPRGEAFVLGWLSHAQRLKRNYPQAIALMKQELTLRRATGDRHGEAYALIYLGTLQRLQRETASAEANLSAGLRMQREIGDRFDQTYALLELAGLRQDAGDIAAAARMFGQALEASRSLRDPGSEANALFHLAQLRRLKGDLDGARRNVESAIAVLESLRAHVQGPRWRASFFASAQDAYEFLIDLLMTMDAARPRRGFAQQALQASERKRARSLLDLWTNAGVGAAAPPQGDLASAIDARSLLDDRTVVLEVSLGETASYAWAITREGMHSARLAPNAEITAAARAFHDLLAAPPSRDAADAERRQREQAAAGAALTRLVLEPLGTHLDRERVAIVADGSLRYVPFAALPEPGPRRAEGESTPVPPLVARHEVVFLPSVAALQRLRKNSPARKTSGLRVAVLADPVFEDSDPRVEPGHASHAASATTAQPPADLLRAARDVGLASTGSVFPRLPYSRQEAEAIVTAAGSGSVLSALDFEASRSTALSARLADHDVVHFATHGFVDDVRPQLSGLVLSLVDRTGQPQDGFLRLRDLYNLRLPVGLVVLSGCRTGLGTEVRGEGLLGIVRAFMHAGAPRIVASVWDVDDRATAIFMKAFYEAMLTSGRAPAAALHDAQLALRSHERWSDPFYWAAFILEGEWN